MSESFKGAMAEMREKVASPYWTNMADRLQRAHDHEMEQLRRSRFREGYEAGQRSMDAEHYAVALRLKHLPLDEDSHGNLSQIARAVWYSDFGWTRGACEALRDELVRLLGGVHEIESGGAASCACDAGCDCGCEQPQTVAYDVLDNERHKAVCELRKLDGCSPLAHGFRDALAAAICVPIDGAPYDDKELCHLICDRLIHLLGGDQPTAMEYIQRIVREHDRRRLDIELIGAELSQASVDAMSRRAESDKNGDICKTEPSDTVESSKYRENYKSGYITDELREWMDLVLTADDQAWAIADRIDQQHNDLQKKLDKVMKEANRHRWEYCETCEVSKTCDDLRKSLREIAERAGVPHDVDLDEYSDDLVAKATLGKIDSTHEYIGALEWQRDRQKKLLDKYERRDTAEDIVRDIHLGKVTDMQAIERIRALP